MRQKEKGDESPEIPPLSQHDEWWNRDDVLEATTEWENAFVKQQKTSNRKAKSVRSKSPTSREGPKKCPILS